MPRERDTPITETTLLAASAEKHTFGATISDVRSRSILLVSKLDGKVQLRCKGA